MSFGGCHFLMSLFCGGLGGGDDHGRRETAQHVLLQAPECLPHGDTWPDRSEGQGELHSLVRLQYYRYIEQLEPLHNTTT